MKRLLPNPGFVLLAFAGLLGFAASNKKNMAPATGTALVELFTSEGCSSCPPADEALAAVAKAYPGNVLVLGFHVDYWDRLGWKDPFSNAAWTARQNQYAGHLHLNSIYTPQAIVNGKTEFTGSDRTKLYKTIEQELKIPAAMALNLEVHNNADKSITVSYQLNAAPAYSLNIALVQRNADTQVKRGENEGKLLHHINIVRDLKTLAATTGSTAFHLPAGLSAADCSFIAFLQNNSTLAVSAAVQSPVH